ncbi:class V chitinase [Cajanus cajan]|uniref:class V chitinase n=1 Tax=Cajanus cajan TaxID=3821 RepID=UPI00098DB150|nr:class V chitinase [Cajanus cajan]
MANSKTLWFLIATLLLLQLHFSPTKAAIKGGYWYSDSGLAVADINATLFTHLFCAFADLDNTTYKVTISSSNAAKFSTFTQTVQAKNPSVKTLLSIGGGGGPTLAARFSKMASQAATRKAFIDSSVQLARANNLLGLDLDWEYPSSDADKSNFVALLKEWKAAITQDSTSSGKPRLLLSAAVAGSDQISPLQYYSGPDMANYLDFINLMTYDLFTSDGYPTSTQPPAPLYNPRGMFSVDQGVLTWNRTLGVPLGKLALGLPFYGYKWRLANSNSNGLFSAATAGLGAVGYSQIKAVGATAVYNSTFVTNYCSRGTDWYGYDDVQTVTAKVAYAKRQGLFGYFAWQLGTDNNWALSLAASQAWGA